MILRVPIVMAVLVVGLATGAATEAKSRHPVGHAAAVVGTASWYGWRLQGRRMADGQPFHALSSAAASPVLPLGSRVKVTNLARTLPHF